MMDREKYIELFSKERIDSYQSIEEHDENLRFISELTTRLAVIELTLRNRIDNFLKKENINWLYNLYRELDINIKSPDKKDYKSRILNKIKKEIECNEPPTNDQLVSKLNFGFWVDLSYYLLKQKPQRYGFSDILDILYFCHISRNVEAKTLQKTF